jgi:hypothetical protein
VKIFGAARKTHKNDNNLLIVRSNNKARFDAPFTHIREGKSSIYSRAGLGEQAKKKLETSHANRDEFFVEFRNVLTSSRIEKASRLKLERLTCPPMTLTSIEQLLTGNSILSGVQLEIRCRATGNKIRCRTVKFSETSLGSVTTRDFHLQLMTPLIYEDRSLSRFAVETSTIIDSLNRTFITAA